MRERFDVIVIGSGAGGGVVAGELAQRGRKVLLLEAGPHRTAIDFQRFESRASRDLFWPLRMARTGDPDLPSIALAAGRCVGGSTTVNGNVALRPSEEDLAKWADASAPVNDRGEPLALSDLEPYFERVERVMGVRRIEDRPAGVEFMARGFERVGARLEPMTAYVDYNCFGCGSCMCGCPTNSAKSTLVSYIHPALATRRLELRAECTVTRVVIEEIDGSLRAAGVEYVDRQGVANEASAGAVVVAAGALATPQLLLRSGIRELTSDSPSATIVGQNLGLHISRHLYGRFDQALDLHEAYTVADVCYDHVRDADGGFLVYSASLMDPVGLASTLVDEDGAPLWGSRLTDFMNHFRNIGGVIAMINDENTGTVEIDEDGHERISFPLTAPDAERLEAGRAFAEHVLLAAGALEIYSTMCITGHVQGTARMGSDPSRSFVDSRCESHDVRALYVADASVFPRTLSVGPSLAVLALATRAADCIDEDPDGYLPPAAVGRAVTAP